MSVIACLGWGSLIWNPAVLQTRGIWHDDGPMIRVEFLRKSDEGRRITLVLDEDAPPTRSLWTVMNTNEIDTAAENLRVREGTLATRIGRWRRNEPSPANIHDLPAWAIAHGVDEVVWTALGHNFHDSGARPSADDVVRHLAGLPDRKDVERYVRRAPPQIDTPYRRVIEGALGWTPKESD